MGKISNKDSLPEYFNVNGKQVTWKNEIANGFNDYFTTVGESLKTNIHSAKNEYVSYLTENFVDNIFLTPTDPYEVGNIIKALKSKKSSGIDKLNSILVKKLPVLERPVSITINKFILTATVPNCLKIAKIIPIYKARRKGRAV